MRTAEIIKFDEDDEVVCPVCNALIIGDEGLSEQPSCEHVVYVFANAEAWEADLLGLEERLNAAQDKADEEQSYFDLFEWVAASEEADLILEQVSESMACGSLTFTTWIGIRETPKDSRSRRLHLVAASEDRLSYRKYFHATGQFVRWVKTHHGNKLIYDIGAGVGQVSSALTEAGLRVTALDLEPCDPSEFDVIKADCTEYAFQKDSVLLFCRPCHDHDFVRNTILRGLTCGVRAVVYVGLQRNVRADLGGYFRQFTQRRISGIGQSDERICEMKISRAQADACLRRGAIPPLSD
jgi:hypothetical protein